MFQGYEHLIGGFAGGFASTCSCHPLDLLKMRFAANEGSTLRPQYRSSLDAAISIVKANGVRGLYQGFTPNIIGTSVSYGMYFQIYHFIRPRVELFENQPADNFLVGTLTGIIVHLTCNPFLVVKTRLCLQYENEGARKYLGMIDCFRKIIKHEGYRALYKGFTPGLLGVVNGSIQFTMYNYLKDWCCQNRGIPQHSHLGSIDIISCSIISKVSTTIMCFPYQVIRTRLQDHNTDYHGVSDVIRRTYRGEGWRGFYKGCFLATAKQTPIVVITFFVYEYVKYGIERLNEN